MVRHKARKTWLSLLLAAAAVALVGGCSCSFSIGGDSLDRADAEQKIGDALAAGDGVEPETVSCPDADDVKLEADQRFECTATDGEDLLANLEATLSNGEGDFNWLVTGTIDLSAVERQIEKGLEREVGVEPKSVDCPPAAEVELAEGEVFECTGVAPAGDGFAIDVTLTDAEGDFEFEVPDAAAAPA